MSILAHESLPARYMREGFAIFPVKRGEKRPATDNGHHYAHADLSRLAEFDDLNVGIPMGRDFWALDLDGEKGCAWLEDYEAKHGKLPATRVHRTPSGGLHFIWRTTPGRPVYQSASRIAPSVDTRALRKEGDKWGGYVVAPPSIYTFTEDDRKRGKLPEGVDVGDTRPYLFGNDHEPVQAPSALLDIVCTATAPTAPNAIGQARDFDPEFAARVRAKVDAAIEMGCRDIVHAEDGTQNNTIVRVATKFGAFVGAGALELERAYGLLAEAADQGGHPSDRANTAILRGLNHGMDEPFQFNDEDDPAFTAHIAALDEKLRARQAEEAPLEGEVVALSDADADLQWQIVRELNQRKARVLADEPFAAWLAEYNKSSAKFKTLGEWWDEDDDEADEPIWGRGDISLWQPGESIMFFGAPGSGKTSLGHAVLWARLGEEPSEVMGYPVRLLPEGEKVLYIAKDRPKQIRRLTKRARNLYADQPEKIRQLRERVIVPEPKDLGSEAILDPTYLRDTAISLGCTVIVVDSVMDLAPNASDELTGGRYNDARQACVAAGIEWMEFHHDRKSNGDNTKTTKQDDVYGSRQFTKGAGSIIVLHSKKKEGEVFVLDVGHIKSPMDQMNSVKIEIAGKTGEVRLHEPNKAIAYLRKNVEPRGSSTREICVGVYGEDFSDADLQRTREDIKKGEKTGEILYVRSEGKAKFYRIAVGGTS